MKFAKKVAVSVLMGTLAVVSGIPGAIGGSDGGHG